MTAQKLETKKRIRISVPEIYRNESLAIWLQNELSHLQFCKSVRVNTLTCNVSILFSGKNTLPEKEADFLIRKILEKRPVRFRKVGRDRARVTAGFKTPVWYRTKRKTVQTLLKTSSETGLTSANAMRSRQRFGSNRLVMNTKTRSDLSIFTDQFKSLPMAMLGASATASAVTGGVVDASVIAAVSLINGYIGYATEATADHVIQSVVRSIEVPAKIVRDGKTILVDADEVVVGDVLLLEPGLLVAADARLIRIHNLSVDESILTGESVPVEKTTRTLSSKLPLGDRTNMVFRGTTVTGGSGRAIVVAVGPATELGRIQRLLTDVSTAPTPLQKELASLGGHLAITALSASSLLMTIGLVRGHPMAGLLRAAISMAVAAIPESLPTIATTTLARGVTSLKQQDVLVRKIDALETLAKVDVVCFDKTGTLTTNRMEVAQVSCNNETLLYETVVLCNDATLKSGTPTEKALLIAARKNGVKISQLRRRYPREHTRYRSERKKYMLTIHAGGGRRKLYAVKGSPNEVLDLCAGLTSETKQKIRQDNELMGLKGLRVLGVARGTSRSNLEWLGLVGMADPIRTGIKELLPKFQNAGIETAMITGDQPQTAKSVAKKLGLKSVYARVSPARKLEIIRELQAKGRIVAMIGDGINDGPALRAADIGIAMTKSGADVAAKAADIILTRDNLEGILIAIKEGRTVREDIKKAVNYILTQNLSEVLLTLVSVAIGGREPLTPLQFLWINLVTDIFPELALAQEAAESDLMNRPPTPAIQGIITAEDLRKIVIDAAILTAAPVYAYRAARVRGENDQRAQTLAFISVIGTSLFYTFSARSKQLSIFDRERLAKNKYVPAAVASGFLAEILGLTLPGLKRLLGSESVTAKDILTGAAGSVLPTLIIEVAKFFNTTRNRNLNGSDVCSSKPTQKETEYGTN